MWDSTSKILRLTVGSGVFNWRAAAERLSISIDISDLAFFSTSHSQLLVANMVEPTGVRISVRFAEIWIASLAPTFLVGYQFASRRRTASRVLGARRCPLRRGSPAAGPCLPRTGRPSSGPTGNGAGSDGHVHLNRRVRKAQSLSKRRIRVVEARAKRLSVIPITVGYRLHGER